MEISICKMSDIDRRIESGIQREMVIDTTMMRELGAFRFTIKSEPSIVTARELDELHLSEYNNNEWIN